MFSFFVHNVAAEQLHLKVCMKLGSWNRAQRCLSREGWGLEQVPQGVRRGY